MKAKKGNIVQYMDEEYGLLKAKIIRPIQTELGYTAYRAESLNALGEVIVFDDDIVDVA